MQINTDINILGGLPDLNLVHYFLFKTKIESQVQEEYYTYSAIKTDKSVKRFERAIHDTFLRFNNKNSECLGRSILAAESISSDSLLFLFWNASMNNELLHYLNIQVFFPAFYSGRLIIKKEEVEACLTELKETELTIQQWTKLTIETVARKYLTLMKKFNIMEGSLNKKILHPYLSDKMFVLFIYWINAVETRPNLLESEWLQYCFCERSVFIERVLQRKFSKFFELTYTGDKLKIETSIDYENIYDATK